MKYSLVNSSCCVGFAEGADMAKKKGSKGKGKGKDKKKGGKKKKK
jgi:hypothetical protein